MNKVIPSILAARKRAQKEKRAAQYQISNKSPTNQVKRPEDATRMSMTDFSEDGVHVYSPRVQNSLNSYFSVSEK